MIKQIAQVAASEEYWWEFINYKMEKQHLSGQE